MTDSRDLLDALIEEAARPALARLGFPAPHPESPSDEELLAYVDGAISNPVEAEHLRQRIARDPEAQSRLSTLQQALREVAADGGEPEEAVPAAQESWTLASKRRIRLAFARARQGLVFLWGTAQPAVAGGAPVPTRGTASPSNASTFFELAHRFSSVELQIQVEHLPSDRLDLQLALRDLHSPPRRLRVELNDGTGALLDSQPVDRGIARFAAIPPETHEIRIRADGDVVGQIRLDVRG